MSSDAIDPRGQPARRDLRAMNSDIELVCYAPDASRRLDRAESWLRAFEQRYSRFSFLSELSRLNRAAGRPYAVSLGLYRLVELALELARRSDGIFDPTVLRSLEAAGYDRSFELLDGSSRASEHHEPRVESRAPKGARPTSRAIPPGNSGRSTGYRDVGLDPDARTISLPEGAGIDLGGIGKGYAVDRLAATLGTPCLVNGGGDVYVAGRPHDAPAWTVGIEDPFAPGHDLRVLAISDGAVATSTTLRRRWRSGPNSTAHHIVDTRTGASSLTDAVQVTVVAPTALLADYRAKVALLLGVEGGLHYVNYTPETEALIVGREGTVSESAGLQRFVQQVP